VKVSVFSSQKDLPINKVQVKKIAKEVVSLEGSRYDEVAIYFVDKPEICRLHDKYFNDPSPTDCISFPLNTYDTFEYRILGEAFVCPAVGMEYVDKQGGEYYDEVTLYVVHGLLHLLGYDDIDRKDRMQMRLAEKRHMEHLQELGIMLSRSKQHSRPSNNLK
jgi:probable rRNA maturation factor